MWGTNSALEARAATLELGFIDLASDWTSQETHKVLLAPNQSTEVVSRLPVAHPPIHDSDPAVTASHSVVVWARLLDIKTGEVLARYSDWPQPYRVLDLPDPEVTIRIEADTVCVDVTRPVKGLVLSTAGDEEPQWEDNNLDMIPGDKRRIKAVGLNGRIVRVAYLGKERAQ